MGLALSAQGVSYPMRLRIWEWMRAANYIKYGFPLERRVLHGIGGWLGW